MQTSYLPITDIFSIQRQYTVPLFQRPYVWERQTQLEPLWEDVRRLADASRAGANPQPHFLGSIVLEKLNSQTFPERRDVIDGQQRLTTLQLLLKAAHDVLLCFGEKDRSLQIRSLLRNFANGNADDEETFKVLPTNVDRTAYKLVMNAQSPVEVPDDGSKISDAYRFFYGEITNWIAENAPSPGQSRDAFFVTLNQRLKFVVLDLDQTDEAQVIFETLNARGTPLLPADLVKNWLLREVERRGLHSDIEKIYKETWSEFDTAHDYWRKESGKGHAARARIDTYIANYITFHKRKVIPTTHLYSEFLSLQTTQDPPNGSVDQGQIIGPISRLRDLKKHALSFRRIDEATEQSDIGTFLRRVKVMDVVSLTPVLLWLFERTDMDEQHVLKFLKMLESFLVRRMICGLETRGYSNLFAELLSHIADKTDSEHINSALENFLLRSSADAGRWPDNKELQKSMLNDPIYKRLTRPRLKMVLLALDEQMTSDKTEKVTIKDQSLQIEHIMPQSWQAHWSSQNMSPADVELRESLIQTVGNLTLVTEKLNPALSNSPWTADGIHKDSKKEALNKHSKLTLNKLLIEKYKDAWNEDAIQERSLDLFKRASEKIWGHPLEIITEP